MMQHMIALTVKLLVLLAFAFPQLGLRPSVGAAVTGMHRSHDINETRKATRILQDNFHTVDHNVPGTWNCAPGACKVGTAIPRLIA